MGKHYHDTLAVFTVYKSITVRNNSNTFLLR